MLKRRQGVREDLDGPFFPPIATGERHDIRARKESRLDLGIE
jgi:hypothetical protein